MQLWPKIAAHFHMESGPNLHISLDTIMNTPEKKDIWAEIVKVSSSILQIFGRFVVSVSEKGKLLSWWASYQEPSPL